MGRELYSEKDRGYMGVLNTLPLNGDASHCEASMWVWARVTYSRLHAKSLMEQRIELTAPEFKSSTITSGALIPQAPTMAALLSHDSGTLVGKHK